MYLSLLCHDQNDSCSKMGSDESHFNVLLIVRDSRKTKTVFEFGLRCGFFVSP